MTSDYTQAMRVAKRELETARKLINEEVRSYPTPISGCDAQFNYLLAQRTRIANALNVLDQTVFVATPRTLVEGGGVESR